MAWRQTPFLTIEEAHQVAEVMGLQPSPLSTQGEAADALRTFSTRVLLVAQRASGPPAPVLQKELGQKLVRKVIDPNAPHWGEHDRLGVGTWVGTDHASLEEAVAHRRKNMTDYKPPVLQGTLVTYKEPKGEYTEYLDTGEGTVLMRSFMPIHPKARKNEGYLR